MNNANIEATAKNDAANPVVKFFKSIFKRKPSLDARKARSGYIFVAPFIIGVLLVYLPILADAIWFSFNEMSIVTGGGLKLTFCGLQHYQVAFQNANFVTALLAGIQQLIFEVPAIIVFSLFIAVVLNEKMLGRAVFRAIFFVPVIIATGVMESILSAQNSAGSTGEGIDDGSGASSAGDLISTLDLQILFANMKVGGELVSYVVSIVNNVYNIINYSGVQMLIFLAGLQSISPSIYEASRIDGASGWETFWKITFPMISPMILVNAIYTIIDSFTRTTNPAMSYINSQVAGGVSSAMSWMYFIIVMLIIAIVAGIASSFVFYQRRD